MLDPIQFEECTAKEGKLGIITLNRPEALNALNLPMCAALEQQLAHWQKQDVIKAVVIQGAGERAFCAGGDLRAIYQAQPRAIQAKHFFWQEYRTDWQAFNFPKPYIALLHGVVMGGGVGISLPASHRVVSENLLWAMPETGIGLFPDVGVSYFLARLPEKLGIYLGLSGARLSAADALALRLADTIMPQARFAEFIAALANTALGNKPYTAIDQLLQQFALAAPPAQILAQSKLINYCFAAATVEEIIQRLLQASQPWAKQTAELLLKRSPMSLKITLQQLQESQHLQYEACLRRDYRLANHMLQHPDFMEGIRATIIDKTQQPHWSPNELSKISAKAVNAFFAPLAEELIVNSQ